MGNLYGPLSVQAGSSTPATIAGYPDTGAIIAYNESPFFVTLTMSGGASSLPLAAYTADIIGVQSGFNGGVTLTGFGYLSSAGATPSNVIFLRTVSTSEPLYQALVQGASTGFPIPLGRMANVGNDITIMSSSLTAETLVNIDTNNGANVVNIRPVGGAATYELSNDGGVAWQTWDGVTARKIMTVTSGTGNIQIGGSGNVTEIGANLQVDGVVQSASGTDTVINGNGPGTLIRFNVSAVETLRIAAGGILQTVGSAILNLIGAGGVTITAGAGTASMQGVSGASVNATAGPTNIVASTVATVQGASSAVLSAISGTATVQGSSGVTVNAIGGNALVQGAGTASVLANGGQAKLQGSTTALVQGASNATITATAGTANVTGSTTATVQGSTQATIQATGGAVSAIGSTTATVQAGSQATVQATSGSALLQGSTTATVQGASNATIAASAGSANVTGSTTATVQAGSGTATLTSTAGAANVTAATSTQIAGGTTAQLQAGTGNAVVSSASAACSLNANTTASLVAGTVAGVYGSTGSTVDTTAGTVVLSVNAVPVATIATGSMTMAKKIVFPDATALSGLGSFNGTGPGTFSHGAPTTPYRVWFQTNSGTAQAISYDTLTSTSVNVHVGAAISWFGFYILNT